MSLPVLEDADLYGVSHLSDRDLLMAGREAVVAQNRAVAQKVAHLVEFYRRRAATYADRLSEEPHFTLTARQETVAEVAPLWGLPQSWLRVLLNNALFLTAHLPAVWALVREGALDEYRLKLVVEGARLHHLTGSLLTAYDEQMAAWLRRQLRNVELAPETWYDGVEYETPIVTCTTKQLRNRITYVRGKLKPADAEESYRRKMNDRRASAREDTDGFAWLSIGNSTDKVQTVMRRLTLGAERRRAEGDERTLDQLRADLACDLIAGTLTCDDDGVVTELPVPLFARPVVHLTVPATTVMGLNDEPGMLSGGTVVPAGLARKIAADPSSTWYRMLTDEAGQMVELSTKSYSPTPAIVRHVVARDVTCHGCDKPASECDLDHRLRFPEGSTSSGNLGPSCKTDHKTKHAPGFGLVQDPDGSWTLTTAAGFRHPIRPVVQPTSNGIPDVPITEEDFQLSVTEVAEAIRWLRHERDLHERQVALHELWEYDPEHYALRDVA